MGALLLLSLLVPCLYFARLAPHPRRPPCISGWIPFVRAGWRFSTRPSPQGFIQQAHRTHGDVFTVEMFGRRMTYVFSAEGVDKFFHASASTVNFVRAVEPFTYGIFGLHPRQFAGVLHPLLKLLREDLTAGPDASGGPSELAESTGLAPRISRFRVALDDELQQLRKAQAVAGQSTWHVDGLFAVCGRLMFRASLRALFGEAFATHCNRDDHLYRTFCTFDEWFEMAAASIPQWLLPRFGAARRELLRCMRRGRLLLDDTAPMARLLAQLNADESLQVSVMLTMLWASSSNTMQSAGWLVAHIAAAREEPHTADEAYVWNAVVETLRLISSGMAVRLLLRPLSVGEWTLPAGDYLCISPWLNHRRGDVDAQRFRASRFQGAADKTAIFRGRQRALQTFGGGAYRCPGQVFALHELVTFAQMFFEQFCRVRLLSVNSQVPPCDDWRLVGVKRPLHDVAAELCWRTADPTGG
ncbi:hypothetical protein CDCA_CDCA10G3029 [Cyanidium caldarium]|uniref:Cytochrome P450 n=1 Tax=Cyanidium caldarium TaxID=2771 RepID=A0AAV9IY23_CYACA|nr:hypothetical protein CDCA_CDCA10G3029 [Cyanidium caldarium]